VNRFGCTVDVVVEVPGYSTARRSVSIEPGSAQDVNVSLARVAVGSSSPIASRAGPSSVFPALAWTAMGVGVVGAISFATFFGLATNQHAELIGVCDPQHAVCPTDAAFLERVATGETYQTMTNVSIAVGVAGVALGVLFFVVAPRAERRAGRARVMGRGAGIVVEY
jgi:hypothetical protein